jgi:NAD+ synthase (glutamine-hydrolysing)
MKAGLAQINTTVGDLRANEEKILSAYREAVAKGADVVLTPELALTGYPPQDLVFKSQFVPLALEALDRLEQQLDEAALVVGFVDRNDGAGNPFRNAAAILQRGRPRRVISKTLLPTYDVFDEGRYFQPAAAREVITLGGARVGVTICEDIWPAESLHRPLYDIDPPAELAAQGVDCILNLSASPYHINKPRQRTEMLAGVASRLEVPIVYCNAVGGNDQLVFDGHSTVVSKSGSVMAHLAGFREEIAVVDLDAGLSVQPSYLEEPEEIYSALVLGLRDYFAKCGFRTAVLGLSGGIDSAVTAAIAADALGPQNVFGVTMPARYSSGGSVEDSRSLARNIGMHFLQIPIEPMFKVFLEQLSPHFAGLAEDTTEENLQPRIRGMILMALSNKMGHLVLSTGNKSELAVGYCTLYGDMCGGLAVISDVPKTKVYELARWINRTREIIPCATIEKPPSAELKPNQVDQDTLPPYDLLDAILALYVEEQMSARDIIARGFDEKTVRWVQRRVDLNEYKRVQAPPGIRVTSKAFGSGRRMPLAQRFVD